MLIQPYQLEELHFAWCNRIYFRTRTLHRASIEVLPQLTASKLSEILEPYGLHVLEFTATTNELQGLLSLASTESTSTAMSKTKGRISKWINDHAGNSVNPRLLAKGYFALTTGQATSDAVSRYLRNQPAHHGYMERARPPVYVRSLSPTERDAKQLHSDNAVTRLRYHLVLAITLRRGVFGAESAAAVTSDWLQHQERFLIDKVSFLPDHVHIAISLHPSAAPAAVACELMNNAQALMWEAYPDAVVRARIERLWQPSAYIGSFGDLSSNAVSGYMKRWIDAGDE